jgi:hypothetical protein
MQLDLHPISDAHMNRSRKDVFDKGAEAADMHHRREWQPMPHGSTMQAWALFGRPCLGLALHNDLQFRDFFPFLQSHIAPDRT